MWLVGCGIGRHYEKESTKGYDILNLFKIEYNEGISKRN